MSWLFVLFCYFLFTYILWVAAGTTEKSLPRSLLGIKILPCTSLLLFLNYWCMINKFTYKKKKLLVHDFFLRKARSLLKDCIFSSVQFLPEIPFHPLLKKKAFEILTWCIFFCFSILIFIIPWGLAQVVKG